MSDQVREDVVIHCYAHITLARLYLLTGDSSAARPHSEEASRLSAKSGDHRLSQRALALGGLINVWSGDVEAGLAAVQKALTFAKQTNQGSVFEYLGMCIDAYEVAGQPDEALEYLRELVEWQKKTLAKELVALEYEGVPEPIRFQVGSVPAEEILVAKAYGLHAGVEERIQHLIDTAINAEMAAGHDLYRTFRVARLACNLAASLGWQKQRIDALSLGAQLCNIGMVAIPARISLKPGVLTPAEREVLHDHPRHGAELLRKSKLRLLDIASVISEQHHERYDGSGYPVGLKYEAIAEEARLVAVCDVFDAMTHSRPYRSEPLPFTEAINQLKQAAGSQFDPVVVLAFVDLIQTERLKRSDLDAFLAEGAQELEYVRVRERMEPFIQTKDSVVDDNQRIPSRRILATK